MTVNAAILVGFTIIILLGIIRARGRTNKRLAERNGKLSAALKVAERKLGESNYALTQAESKIRGLQGQISSLIREATSNKPLCEPSQKRTIAVPPNGTEVFLPPLDPRRVYEITLQGTCRFSEDTGFFSSREAHADALYRTDEVGNFLKSHDCLKLGQVSIRRFLKGVPRETMPAEDRKAHRYSFRIDGAATKTSVSFHVAFDHVRHSPSGPLALTIELLPDGTPSPAAGRRREEAAEESAKRAEQAAKENSALEAKVEGLRRRAHHESHFLDAEFQEQYARHNANEILAHLKKDWTREYDEVVYGPLKRIAEEKAPEVIQWLEARVKIVQLAERLTVGPLPAREIKPVGPVTAEEIRAAELRKHADEHDLRIALAKLRGEKAAEADAVLKSLPLDDDLKERLKTELTDSILDAEGKEEGGNGVTL